MISFLEKTFLTRQSFGTEMVIVGIHGDKEEDILDRFNSFFNHQATNGELHWMKDGKFGYFFSSEADLLRGLTFAALFYLLQNDPNKFKKCQCGAMKEATRIAQNIIENIPEEPILNISNRQKMKNEEQPLQLYGLKINSVHEFDDLLEKQLC